MKQFVYAVDGLPKDLDPAKGVSVRKDRISWLRFDALINTTKDGMSFEEGLAIKPLQVPSGCKDVTFTIRKGVKFHDGTDLTADLVKSSFEYFTKENSQFPKGRMLNELISQIQVPSELEVRFILKYPGFSRFTDIEVVKVKEGSSPPELFGTGPFSLEQAEGNPFKKIILHGLPTWHGMPKIEKVVFDVIPNESDVVKGLQNGKVHFYPSFTDPIAIKTILSSTQVIREMKTGWNLHYLGFLCDKPPFDDPAYRNGIAKDLDSTVQKKVDEYNNKCGMELVIHARGPLPPTMIPTPPMCSPSVVPTIKPGNPKPSGQLMYSKSNELHTELASAVPLTLSQWNIKAQPKDSFEELVKDVIAGKTDTFIYTWHVREPKAERFLVPLFHSKYIQTSNLTRYKDTTVDGLLDQLPTLLEGPGKEAVVSEIVKKICEDRPMVFLYHANRLAAYNASVNGKDLDLKVDCMPGNKLVKV